MLPSLFKFDVGNARGMMSLSAVLLLASGSIPSQAPARAATDSVSTAKQVDRQPVEPSAAPPISSSNRFSCQVVDGQYTVVYSPESQPGQFYPWAVPMELGGGWTPDLRCNEISRRLESYRPDGLLEMQTGVENGYNTICVTTQSNSTCRIVLTVPPGQDPLVTRDRVFENLAVADSGQRTDAVNTYTGDDSDLLGQIGEALDLNLPSGLGQRNRSSSINLRPFLDTADGGTGTQLRNSVSPQNGSRLNPDRFR